MSVFLALDSATAASSIALCDESGQIFSRFYDGKERHSAMLLPLLDEVLAEGSYKVSDLSGIVLSAGPGAFTGLRIGASVVAGLAAAYDLPVARVSSLCLLAAQFQGEGEVCVLLDARMGQYYMGRYLRREGRFFALAEDGIFDDEAVRSFLDSSEAFVLFSGENRLGIDVARNGVQQGFPEARHAFLLQDFWQWQSAFSPIELFYLRNQVTG